MENYVEMKRRHQKEFNALPIKAAFGQAQFDKMMREFGLEPDETDQIYRIGSGCFILRKDADKLHELMERHDAEIKAVEDIEWWAEAFYYELGNHEYCITYDPFDTISSMGFSFTDIVSDAVLSKAWEIGLERYTEDCC